MTSNFSSMKQDVLNKISRIILVSVLVLGVSGTSSAACFLLKCSASVCTDTTMVDDEDVSESISSEHSCCKAQENTSPSCHSKSSESEGGSVSAEESLAEIAGASLNNQPLIPLCCFPLKTDSDSALTEQITHLPTVAQASYSTDFTGNYLVEPTFIKISEARLDQADRYLTCCVFRI